MYAIQQGRRFALDLDGTVGLIQLSSGAMQELSPKAMRNLQDRRTWSVSMDSTGVPVLEDSSKYTATKLWLIFPEFRDLYAIYMVYGIRNNWNGFGWNTYNSGYVYCSPDTTTGLDGSWGAIGEFVNTNGYLNNYPNNITMDVASSSEDVLYGNSINTSIFPRGHAVDNYRSYSVPLTGGVASVRGIRFDLANRGFGLKASDRTSEGSNDYFVQSIHLYGQFSKNAESDSLVFWHPTSDEPLEMSDLDMRDVARGTTTQKKFRVKNVSLIQSAQSVSLSRFVDIDTAPSLLTQYYLSPDGSTWVDVINIGTLVPNAISSQVWVSRNTPLDAQMSANMLGIKATVGSWV